MLLWFALIGFGLGLASLWVGLAWLVAVVLVWLSSVSSRLGLFMKDVEEKIETLEMKKKKTGMRREERMGKGGVWMWDEVVGGGGEEDGGTKEGGR